MPKSTFSKQLEAIEEFEQTPVPATHQKGWGNFLGLYAGEHTAGTEFVIGPLFVAHGVGASALIWGLLLGNLLAVLSWAFMCAPIATKTRLTLYYQLEKICGRRLTVIYNVVNALMFCFLAGSMIAVSATAVGIPFNMHMPALSDIWPNSIGWVIAVICVGSVTTLIAMFGYNQVAKVASLAAPWMILVFIAAAIAVLPELGVTGIGNFWTIANEKIWTGTPLPGQSAYGFWHVLFFAWFCNMAMHIGMADMSILRYARKWYHGFASAAGMYVGHYIAWLASGILYALFLHETQYSAEFAPGPIAYRAAGIAGAVCVVVAGWTTANPTIYRAGLALQAIRPAWKTWKVTMVVGALTTTAACFPGLVMKLLEFVALYGLVLMPMGAVIFIDHHLHPRLGIPDNYAERQGISFNRAAAAAWLASLAICLSMHYVFGIDIFFVGLPGWFIAAGVFLGLSYAQKPRGGVA